MKDLRKQILEIQDSLHISNKGMAEFMGISLTGYDHKKSENKPHKKFNESNLINLKESLREKFSILIK